ncbi:CehA/McbA family metallohydrolase [Wenjunlia vitaminophila]|uniref:CehA/McbA family metallohydrolase n=1 Tax=Wenjunlia vitaminophila TaxID=76728 RepID=UPI0003747FD2|nr:CehA/McbA family metallohydrolase [Wenjunlia vitaminophila]
MSTADPAPGTDPATPVGRRDLLRSSVVGGVAAVLTLSPVDFAGADGSGGGQETRETTGHLPHGVADWVHLPVRVPPGVRQLRVSYSYDRPEVPPGVPGNACDIGIFDQRGTTLGGDGFRGWSGGARSTFGIGGTQATPGYLPGPIGAGTWHVVLGPYSVAPQGLRFHVAITLGFGPPGRPPAPRYPPERAVGRGRSWYRGDGHLHSVHSDGARTLGELAAAARAARLDFVVSTEHNTHTAHPFLGDHAGPDLLVLAGEEITTRNGHCLAYGTAPGTWVDWRYRARDDAFRGVTRRIHRAGGLVVPAHPYCPYLGCAWKFGHQEADAIEVWNGPWGADDEMAVAEWDALLTRDPGPGRRWTPAVGNSDAHREPDVVGLPQTVVLADDLERHALLAGIRAGRCWIAESAEVELSFSATGGRGLHAGIGERLPTRADDEVAVRLEVSGAPGALARLVTDEGQALLTPLPAAQPATVLWRTSSSRAAYVRAEVRRPAGDGGASGLPGAMVAMTNPIFLGGQ